MTLGFLLCALGHYGLTDPLDFFHGAIISIFVSITLLIMGSVALVGRSFLEHILLYVLQPLAHYMHITATRCSMRVTYACRKMLYDYQAQVVDELDVLLHDLIKEQLPPLHPVTFATITPLQEPVHVSVPVDSPQVSEQTLYQTPTLSLLPKPHRLIKEHGQALQRKKIQLEEKLISCGVEGKVTKMHAGPVLSLFEFEPSSHCKLSKIIGLEDDLALALQALSVRIIAPLPGTSAVGFEVAHRQRETVFFYDIVKDLMQDQVKIVPLALGKDVLGNSFIADLTHMPHILVAGTTGSGKSMCLQTLLTGLLMRHAPSDVRVILIDPKRLEFSHYQGIPHLLFPIIVAPTEAVQVLHWVIKTMEERYAQLAQAQVRNCEEYRAQGHHMPYIIIMIDELADLMMVTNHAIEAPIARIAQMARAAGIHMIIATQRPSADVITGLIKVNFPARIACKVASKIDSRVILDAPGAEKLIGKGDMLFLDGQGTLQRLHGAFITSLEIHTVVEHCRRQQQPSYHDLSALQEQRTHQIQDPLLEEIIRYVQQQEEISISSLQRVFHIGYNRSARIMEHLQARGIIDPVAQGKMRKIVHKS